MSPDPLQALAALAAPGQPEATYRRVDEMIQDRVGHIQLTLLLVDGADVARVYSTDHDAYPVGGRKPMGPTPWGEKVLTRQEVFLGRTAADMEWAFFDHAKIMALGQGSIICAPVVYNGVTLGTINSSHRELFYTQEHVAPVAELAPLLIPAFLLARHALT